MSSAFGSRVAGNFFKERKRTLASCNFTQRPPSPRRAPSPFLPLLPTAPAAFGKEMMN